MAEVNSMEGIMGIMKNCSEYETQEFIYELQRIDWIPSRKYVKDMKKITLEKTKFTERQFNDFDQSNPEFRGTTQIQYSTYMNKILEQEPIKNIGFYCVDSMEVFILPIHTLLSNDTDLLLAMGSIKHVWLCYVHKLTKSIFIYENYDYGREMQSLDEKMSVASLINTSHSRTQARLEYDLKLIIWKRLKFYFPDYTINIDVHNKILKTYRKYQKSCAYSTMYFGKTIMNTPRDERSEWADPPDFDIYEFYEEIKAVFRTVLDDNRKYYEVHDEINMVVNHRRVYDLKNLFNVKN